MYDIISRSTISAAEYTAFLARHPPATPYHLPAWSRVLRDTYGYADASLVATRAGAMVGVLPLARLRGWLKGARLVGLPYSHYVPLLADDDDARAALLNAALDHLRETNAAYLELRTPDAPPGGEAVVQNHISELDLTPGAEAVLADISSSKRRNIRAAEKAGLHLRDGLNAANCRAFYDLVQTTRRRQGVPVYPRGFFETLAAELGEAAHLLLAEHEGRVVAGLLWTGLPGSARAIYAYGASLRDETTNKLRANDWLFWQAIQQAATGGYTLFDFGTTPLHHTSLLEYKDRFRPQHRELAYHYFLHRRDAPPVIQREGRSAQLVSAALQRLPGPAYRAASAFLMREIG